MDGAHERYCRVCGYEPADPPWAMEGRAGAPWCDSGQQHDGLQPAERLCRAGVLNCARLAADNGLILVLDPDLGEVPLSMAGDVVAATSSCVAVGVLNGFDGVTTVYLDAGSSVSESAGLSMLWAGIVETRERICVTSVRGEVLLEAQASKRAIVQVWANDRSEPDVVRVSVLGESASEVRPVRTSGWLRKADVLMVGASGGRRMMPRQPRAGGRGRGGGGVPWRECRRPDELRMPCCC